MRETLRTPKVTNLQQGLPCTTNSNKTNTFVNRFNSLVLGRHRPATFQQAVTKIGMPENTIVISDDDSEPNASVSRGLRQDADSGQNVEAGSSSRPRIELSSSPAAQRDSKRQKLNASKTSAGASNIKTEHPLVQLNFMTDENGTTQAYPTFFEEAIAPLEVEDSDDYEDVEIVMQAPKIPRKEPEPPYFDDPKYHIRMYRGPGFEHFPIPVDFDLQYKELCDEWDKRAQIKAERRRLRQTRHDEYGSWIDESIQVDDSDNEVDKGKQKQISKTETDCLARILEVLPNVQQEFVLAKIRSQHESYDFEGEEIEIMPHTGAIVAELLEMPEYPKQPKDDEVAKEPFEDQVGKTIKWVHDHKQNRHYHTDSVILMANVFEYVPTHHIDKTMRDKRSLWDAYLHIDDAETSFFSRKPKPYQRLRRPRTELEKKYRRDTTLRIPQYYAQVVCELQAAKQYAAREFLKKDRERQKEDAEKANFERHKQDGLIVECQCCFDDEVPLNRAVQCGAEEHSFCYSCIENLANSQIGLMRHEMQCMDGSGCKEKLDVDGIGRAIPLKTFDRLLFNAQQAEIAAANIEGLEQCPFCDFKAICEPIEIDTIFSCQNPDCFKVTCRKCHEISHLPKTCEEVKKDRGLSARHKVEEARSSAMMRPCPKCKTNIVKEMGCNKMRCQCGTVMCYACKKDLSALRDGYDHFYRGDASGDKCPLYDDPTVDRHAKEANDAELKAIEEAKATDETVEESVLRIDTGKPTVVPTPVQPPLPAGLNGLAALQAHHAAIQQAHNRIQGERPLLAQHRVRGRRRDRDGIDRRNEQGAAPQVDMAPQFPAPPQPLFANIVNNNNPVNIGAWRNNVVHVNNDPRRDYRAVRPGIAQAQNQVQHNAGVPPALPPLDLNPGQNDLNEVLNRIHGLDAEGDRMRQALFQRRNPGRGNQNHLLHRLHNFDPGERAQQREARNAPHQDIWARTQARNQQAIDTARQFHIGNFGNHNVINNQFLNDPFGVQNDRNAWREQFRPPTPIPANNIMDRGRPQRRRTIPVFGVPAVPGQDAFAGPAQPAGQPAQERPDVQMFGYEF